MVNKVLPASLVINTLPKFKTSGLDSRAPRSTDQDQSSPSTPSPQIVLTTNKTRQSWISYFDRGVESHPLFATNSNDRLVQRLQSRVYPYLDYCNSEQLNSPLTLYTSLTQVPLTLN